VLQRPVELAQYGSRAFAGLCDQIGVTRSMGAVGTSADNAACESFHASLPQDRLRLADPLQHPPSALRERVGR
jgi:transposase InsO family protein